MKSSIYTFDYLKGIERRENIFLWEYVTTNDFFELHNLFRLRPSGKRGLELGIDFIAGEVTIFPKKNCRSTSKMIDWKSERSRFIGFYLSPKLPVIIEFDTNYSEAKLFYNDAYIDLDLFIRDFKTDPDLTKSFKEVLNTNRLSFAR